MWCEALKNSKEKFVATKCYDDVYEDMQVEVDLLHNYSG